MTLVTSITGRHLISLLTILTTQLMPVHPENSHPVFNSCISYYSSAEIQKYRENSKLFPYSLFTLYYGNPYFSIHQCVEIDSINYSIDKLLESGEITDEEHSIYLSFLIYCLNLIVISVGDHFAAAPKK